MNIICTLCPQGCELHVDGSDKVSGNRCPRGAAYALEEKTAPRRTLTTTLQVQGGLKKRVSIKSKEPIYLKDQDAILRSIEGVVVDAPLSVGDLLSQLGDSGVDFLVTSEVNRLSRRV